MRLVTWNVNSLRVRLPRVVELLEAHAPDVACLQETKVAASDFPHAELAEAGYHAVERSEGRWNGVAILARVGTELADPEAGLPDEPAAHEARWLEATVGGVRVASVYVPNGRDPAHPMFQQKLAFLDAVRARLRGLVARGPTVVCGDFNVAPTDQDVWDPAAFVGATHVTPDERDRVAAIVADGMTDAYRAVSPDDQGFTWWDYRMGAFHRGMGMRIDLALVSPHLEVRSVEVDTRFRRNSASGLKPSDHAPLVIELHHT